MMRALLPIAIALAACSNSTTQPDGGVSFPEDAASGPQPVGAPCDPAIASPCLPTGDDCLGVYCDPNAHVCTQYVTDAGPPCNASATPCMTSSACDLGLTCGFPIGAGCGAQGVCIDVALSCEDDAAACSGGGTACGCGGGPVSVVIAGYASGPSPSGASVGGPCPADSGAPAQNGDAGGAGDGGDGGTGP